jgi:hypothetical protein
MEGNGQLPNDWLPLRVSVRAVLIDHINEARARPREVRLAPLAEGLRLQINLPRFWPPCSFLGLLLDPLGREHCSEGKFYSFLEQPARAAL